MKRSCYQPSQLSLWQLRLTPFGGSWKMAPRLSHSNFHWHPSKLVCFLNVPHLSFTGNYFLEWFGGTCCREPLSMCVYVCVCIWVQLPVETRRGQWISWSWSNKQLWVTWWVLGAELRSSSRIVYTPRGWPSFPALEWQPLKQSLIHGQADLLLWIPMSNTALQNLPSQGKRTWSRFPRALCCIEKC